MIHSDNYTLLMRCCIEKAIRDENPILVADESVKKEFKTELKNMGFEEHDATIMTLEDVKYRDFPRFLIFDPEFMITRFFDIDSIETYYHSY